MESQVQNLHEQIMAITSGRMKATQKKVDDISKNLDKVRQEVTRLKVGIRTAERFVMLQSDSCGCAQSTDNEVHLCE